MSDIPQVVDVDNSDGNSTDSCGALLVEHNTEDNAVLDGIDYVDADEESDGSVAVHFGTIDLTEVDCEDDADPEEPSTPTTKDDWCKEKFWEAPVKAVAKGARTEIPSWCKVAVVAEGGDLRSRKQLAAILGLATTPKLQQVNGWRENLAQHRQQSGPGLKTKSRIVDGSRHSSKYKPIWDKVYAWIKARVEGAERMSLRGIRRKVRTTAEEEGTPAHKLMPLIPKFRQRYQVRITKASRVTKDTTDVQILKTRMFHWFMKQVQEHFPDLPLTAFTNCDEIPISPSGNMGSSAEVCVLGREKDNEQAANPHRATTFDIRDQKYRCGSFLPLLSPEMKNSPPFALMLFKGGTRDKKESQAYDKRVVTTFNESGSVGEKYMLEVFMPAWRKLEGPTPRVRVLLMDHHRAHVTPAVEEAFVKARTVLAKIPKSMTSILQTLDVHLFSRFRDVYQELIDEWAEKHPGVKVTAGLSRKITQNCCAATLAKVVGSYKYEERFRSLGYYHPEPGTIQLRALKQYRYDPDWYPDADVTRKTREQLESVAEELETALVGRVAQTEVIQLDVPLPAKKKDTQRSLLNLGVVIIKKETTTTEMPPPPAETIPLPALTTTAPALAAEVSAPALPQPTTARGKRTAPVLLPAPPKRARKESACTLCLEPGHNKTTCKKKKR